MSSLAPAPTTSHPSQGVVTPLSPLASSSQGSVEEGGLENAGRLIDQHMKEDHGFRELSGQLMIPSHSKCIRASSSPIARVDFTLWTMCTVSEGIEFCISMQSGCHYVVCSF